MPGAMRAVAATSSAAGAKDISVVSYLPADHYSQRERVRWLDPALAANGAGQVRAPLLRRDCDHLTCCVTELRAARALVRRQFHH